MGEEVWARIRTSMITHDAFSAVPKILTFDLLCWVDSDIRLDSVIVKG